MEFKMKIDNLGCVSKTVLLENILPKYNVDLNELGIEAPRCDGTVQQFKWSFPIDLPLEDVAGYFNEDRVISVLKEAGKPSLKQFELKNGMTMEKGARGTYWIKKPLTIARGDFVITHANMEQGALRVGYVRVEDLGSNMAFAGMLDKSGFGFSLFEFTETEDGKTMGSYYLAQQLPGHLWGWPMVPVLKKKLNNPAFYSTFMKLKDTIEATAKRGHTGEHVSASLLTPKPGDLIMTENNYSKWILITGASTGIGRKTAEYLAKNGYSVYACARKDTDLEALGAIDHVTPVRLDVTQDDEIAAAVEFVEKQGTGLYGLVNNAGITKGGPLVVLPDGFLEQLFDTNFFGMHKVTKAFFPLLNKSKGRIVIMGSVMGFIGYPLVGPYCCSKYAIEAYADCLRRELFLTDVKVSLINPGYVKSDLWEKSTSEFEETKQLLDESIWKPYKATHSTFFEMFLNDAEKYGIDSEKVAKCVFKAVSNRFPRSRYLISEFNPRYWLIKNLFGFQLDIFFRSLYAWSKFKNWRKK